MNGMHVAQVLLLFSFRYGRGVEYPCALVHWFALVDDMPDPLTTMWKVRREYHDEHDLEIRVVGSSRRGKKPVLSVIHLDCVIRAAHLVGAEDPIYLPSNSKVLNADNSLEYFQQFYVNKYIDLHAHELLE